MGVKGMWAVVVFNDEVHTLEEVIKTFTSALEVTPEIAETWAGIIHLQGFVPVGVWKLEKAQEIAQQIRDESSQENSYQAKAGLQVEVDDEVVRKIKTPEGDFEGGIVIPEAMKDQMGKDMDGPIPEDDYELRDFDPEDYSGDYNPFN